MNIYIYIYLIEKITKIQIVDRDDKKLFLSRIELYSSFVTKNIINLQFLID